ncbi:hypothetical protein ABFV05_013027 [Capra hircus]
MKELEMSILRKAQDGEVEGCLRKAPFLDAIEAFPPEQKTAHSLGGQWSFLRERRSKSNGAARTGGQR